MLSRYVSLFLVFNLLSPFFETHFYKPFFEQFYVSNILGTFLRYFFSTIFIVGF